MPQKRVLCDECEREKQLMEAAGCKKVLSCEPDPKDPKFCILVYQFTFLSEGEKGNKPAPASDPTKG